MNYLKKHPYLLLLVAIVLISIFFRTFQLVERLGFAHDNDLYSWIVKDIVVNKHPRLIGQLTTAKGIFIGPAFYYLLIPFFLLTKMDPLGATLPIIIIGVLATLSYYVVFSKLFTTWTGLIAAFLHATLLPSVTFDRLIAPNTPSNLWSIWFFFVAVSVSRGNYQVLPLLGLLAGMIWHIHIALIPVLLTIPIAMFLSKKLPTIKQVLFCGLTFFMTSLPLILFEVRHNFSQTKSAILYLLASQGGAGVLDKLNLITIKMSKTMVTLFASPWEDLGPYNRVIFVILLLLLSWLYKKKVLQVKEIVVLLSWIVGVILFYTFSSTVISEYYLYNVAVVFIGVTSLAADRFYYSFKAGRYLLIILGLLIFLRSFIPFVSDEVYAKGYQEKKAVATYITQEAKKNALPCVAISYITTPGENVGFRYFFWLNNLHVNQPSSGSPVYSIVIPEEMASSSAMVKFGHIGIIPPESVKSYDQITKSCSGQNSNLTDPMLGYTE